MKPYSRKHVPRELAAMFDRLAKDGIRPVGVRHRGRTGHLKIEVEDAQGNRALVVCPTTRMRPREVANVKAVLLRALRRQQTDKDG